MSELITALCAKGPIEDWTTRIINLGARNCYITRVYLTFSDGSTATREFSFKTRKEALAKEKESTEQLFDGSFVIDKVRSESYFRYWLDEYMVNERGITYNTWYTYNRLLRRNIFPILKNKWMEDVTLQDLLEILNKASVGTLSPLYGLLGSAFKYARKLNFVRFNYAQAAITAKRKAEAKRKADEAAENTKETPSTPRTATGERRFYTLTVKQTSNMLLLAKEKYPGIFLPLLLACTTGCRISEVCAIRYGDVDFEKKLLQVSEQIGRSFESAKKKKGSGRVTQRIPTKTENGIRTIPVPDFVLDEIAAERSRWESSEESSLMETNEITVWHRENGAPYHRSSYAKDFTLLKKDFNLPDDFHWHDLRHAYATIMVNNKANLREVATVLGHANGKFTLEHYVVTTMPVYEEIGAYKALFQEAMPITVKNGVIMKKEKIICEVDGFCDFTQALICSSMADKKADRASFVSHKNTEMTTEFTKDIPANLEEK